MTEDEYQLPEIYEVVFGDRGIDCYTHDDLIGMLNEMYDCYEWMCEYGNELQMKDDLQKLRGV